MTDYVKSTNFASKDALATGNPLKIVKGTEIDTEFNNIATAVATKADLNSPTFIGTPTAPTAAVDTNTTQLATTAFVVAQIADDAPTKTGSGASGTWGINISGNAATATTASNGGVTSVNGTTGAVTVPAGARGQIFTSSGTFTVPSGVTALKVTVIGAGGGSGGCSVVGSGSAGGGSGGSLISYLTGLTPGANISVTVGSGGSAGSSSGTAGGTGGTSSFGAYCSATGGGGSAAGSTSLQSGGSAGSVSGTYNLGYSGSAGGPNSIIPCANAGGGTGASLYWNQGFPSIGGSGAASSSNLPGNPGIGFGAGAGGAAKYTVNQAGAAGAQGIVVVEW